MTIVPELKLTGDIKEMFEKRYLNQFLTEASIFYDNPEMLKDTSFDCVISTRMKTSLAMLISHIGEGQARGRTLILVPPIITLKLSRILLSMCDEDIAKVIRHEVIHIGHWNHGKEMKSLCVEFNASFKGWNLESGDRKEIFKTRS